MRKASLVLSLLIAVVMLFVTVIPGSFHGYPFGLLIAALAIPALTLPANAWRVPAGLVVVLIGLPTLWGTLFGGPLTSLEDQQALMAERLRVAEIQADAARSEGEDPTPNGPGVDEPAPKAP